MRRHAARHRVSEEPGKRLLWTLTTWLPQASLGCLGFSLFICILRAQPQAHSRHREPQMASRQQLVVGVLHLRDDVFVSSGSETATTWPIRRGRAALIAARLATSAASTRSVRRLAEVAPTVLRGRLRRQRALPVRTAQLNWPRRTKCASTAVLGRSAQISRSMSRLATLERTPTSRGCALATHVLRARIKQSRAKQHARYVRPVRTARSNRTAKAL